MEKHLSYVKENIIQVENINRLSSKNLLMDIETCYENTAMLDKNYNQKDKKRKVWSVAIGSVENDLVCLTRNFDDAFKGLQKLGFSLCEDIKAIKSKESKTRWLTLNIGVHNVAYEISYLQHWLNIRGFKYKNGSLNTDCITGVSNLMECFDEYTFSISQSENIFYGMTINLGEYVYIYNKSVRNKFKIRVKFWDTVKIMQDKLENCWKFCNNLDEMFYKLNDKFDYNKVRQDDYIISDMELRYIYNDIKIMKEALNDYYENSLRRFVFEEKEYKISSNLKTASGISFDSALQITFRNSDNYKKAYNEYYEIENRTLSNSKMTKNMEKLSYVGGYTWYNPAILNKKILCDGSSFDINSAYPYMVSEALLPYGLPVERNGRINLNNNELAIYNIGFDFFKPKCEAFNLGMIKLGSSNFKSTKIQKYYKDFLKLDITNGNAYIHTNIINNEVIDIFKDGAENICNFNLTLTSVELEHLEKYYDFGVYKYIYVNDIEYSDKENLSFDGVKIGQSLLYKAERNKFKDFIDYFYNKKSEIKKRLDAGENLNGLYSAVKTILNSFYGKQGTKTERTIDTLVVDEKGIFSFDRGNKNTKKEKILKLKNKERKERILNEGRYIDSYESKQYYMPFASFVTAHSRVYLQRMIIEGIGVDNFLYSDTDSFYSKLNKDETTNRLKAIGIEVHKTNLGAMDNEKNFNSFKTIGAKKYMLKCNDYKMNNVIKKGAIICKCAGVPEKAQKELIKKGFDNFKLGTEVQGKLAKIKCFGGDDLINVKYVIKDNAIKG